MSDDLVTPEPLPDCVCGCCRGRGCTCSSHKSAEWCYCGYCEYVFSEEWHAAECSASHSVLRCPYLKQTAEQWCARMSDAVLRVALAVVAPEPTANYGTGELWVLRNALEDYHDLVLDQREDYLKQDRHEEAQALAGDAEIAARVLSRFAAVEVSDPPRHVCDFSGVAAVGYAGIRYCWKCGAPEPTAPLAAGVAENTEAATTIDCYRIEGYSRDTCATHGATFPKDTTLCDAAAMAAYLARTNTDD